MTSEGLVKLGEILKAIGRCAPEATVALKKHHYWVRFRGKVFVGLPKGSGREVLGSEIEFGQVRKMVRMLGLEEDCFRKHFGLPKP